MREIELDARLGAIAARVAGCRHVADIGADHGRLACWLLEHDETLRMTVSDVSAPSLEKARILLTERGCAPRVRLCVADGLDALTEEADAIVIAGMGAKTIRDILIAGRDKIGRARLLLQPNLDVPRLRAFLWDSGFELIDETALHAAGRHYMLIEARLGECFPAQPLSEKDAFLGAILAQKRDSDTRMFYAWQQRVRQGELGRLCAASTRTQAALDRAEELKKELSWLEEVLCWASHR